MKPLRGHVCNVCSAPISGSVSLCNDCIRTKRWFDKAVAPLLYQGLTRQQLHAFKYLGKSYLYKLFGYQMVQLLKNNDMTRFDGIVPVPIHRRREVVRGYNQSKLLAVYISFHLGIPMVELIKRMKHTPPQMEQKGHARKSNVTHAFSMVSQEQSYKSILLVDDIYTTGATLEACARTLKGSGVEQVIGITVGR